MYEPYPYTTRKINGGRFSYPGQVPLFLDDAEKEVNSSLNSPLLEWDQKSLAQFLTPVIKWQAIHDIPSTQLIVGEFGCEGH